MVGSCHNFLSHWTFFICLWVSVWPKDLKKCPFFKVTQTVCKPKRPKYLNLKAQNIYIKPLSKPKNAYSTPCFETAYLVENVMNLLKQKVAQKCCISLGYLIFSMNHNEPPKVAQLATNVPIWSPWCVYIHF
jgi:hypothetical protein